MIQYENIAQWSRAHARLSRRHYWSAMTCSSDEQQHADHLAKFTTELASQQESKNNLDYLMSRANAIGATVLILKPNIVQLAGLKNPVSTETVAPGVWQDQWFDFWQDWQGGSAPAWQLNQWPECYVMELLSYGSGLFCRRGQTGVYRVCDQQRVSNRREQIELLWESGLPSRRGRPIHVPRQRWSGSKQELIMLTNLAKTHRDREHCSDVSAKFCSAFRSINRYIAWPGAW